MSKDETRELLTREFAALGFSILHWNEGPSMNGVDLWVQRKNKRPLSVEVKSIHRNKKGPVQVEPVQKNRREDDLIAIVCNSEYVLIEPMKDHLKCCSLKGTRQLTVILG